MSAYTTTGVAETYAPVAVQAAASNESSRSAVSWAAVFSGAFANLSITLMLVTLVSGLGLSIISPWQGSGVTAATFAVTTGIGLIVVQWLASATGGFIAGRLRTKWTGLHTHEVFFRDTAHGFLSWAVAAVISGMLLATAASSVVSGGFRVAESVGSGAAQVASTLVPAYDIDSLLRSEKVDASPLPASTTGEMSRILVTGLTNGDVPESDRVYMASVISGRTGISPADSRKRVDDVIAKEKAAKIKAKEMADASRKATAQFALFSALAMAISAFVASAAGAYGGSMRDEY